MAPLSDLVSLRTKLAQPSEPLIWILTGDSITQGAQYLSRERAYPDLIHERIRWELRRRRDLLINTAISGDATGGLLADFNWRVLQFNPNIVSIMIGMNNATQGHNGREQFASDLMEIIQRIRTAGAIPILHTTNPIDNQHPDAKTHVDLPAYNKAIVRVALATDTILIDHWSHWCEARTNYTALRDWLADPLHPNAVGHRQFALHFFRTLGCFDDQAVSCQP